ncbi:MAG TPA: methyltransferase domain-containing protein [Methylomirabilota bacterium]|nr:methyltransferase domain-containing protein [Methylomirabilota bacterium]
MIKLLSWRRLFAGFIATGLALAGCSAPPQRPAAVPAAPEASAKPGINEEFLKPGLNLTQWVERFEREGREIFTERERIVAAMKLRPGLAVADVGAGTGLFTPLLSRAVGPRGRVYAVDIAKDFLAHIERRAAAEGLHNVQTVLCTERSVELPPDSIDLAFICDTYHHFEYPRSTMASLHRALRAGGEVVLVDFKRIPGRSSEWVLNHVRAGQEVFTAEIEAAGFKLTEEADLLKDNYFLRFRKARNR